MNRIPTDPDGIRMLASILQETGLTEIEIAEKDSRIRVVRATSTGGAEVAGSGTSTNTRPALAAASAPAPMVPSPDEASHPGAVLSPMVGVVYFSPEPGAAAFVSLGQQVSAGQTLLLIEAMKTFNQIKAPKAGTVARILVANGTPVEYGEVLMILED